MSQCHCATFPHRSDCPVVAEQEIRLLQHENARLRDRLSRASEVRVTTPSPERPTTMWLGCGVKVSVVIDLATKRPYLQIALTETISIQGEQP